MELLSMLIEDAEPLLATLESTSPADIGAVTELSHALKGISANIGATKLGAAANDLHEAARTGVLGEAQTYQQYLDAIALALAGVRRIRCAWLPQ
jgi:HPt (histidine-containing phosphotransfer) domain-containing protein